MLLGNRQARGEDAETPSRAPSRPLGPHLAIFRDFDIFVANGVFHRLRALSDLSFNHHFFDNAGGLRDDRFLGSLANLNDSFFERTSARRGTFNRLPPLNCHTLGSEVDAL